jgi:hypothetical protein
MAAASAFFPDHAPPLGDFYTTEHQSLAVWLIAASVGNLVILGAAVLGSSYTGLRGDWLSGNTRLGNQIFMAEVGLTEVRLQTGTGSSRTLSLASACAEWGGKDNDASHWCALDTLGADVEAMLTAAFVPALVVLVLSALTAMHNNVCAARIRQAELEARARQVGVTSMLYNLTMLLAWSLFFLMCMAGLCIYALRAPASLGVGPAAPSKSYQLMRACVLFTSLGTLALVARALKLWDTHTVQHFLRDVRESRLLKRAIYALLGAQLLLYAVVTLLQLNYAAVIVFLGANYLATRAPQVRCRPCAPARTSAHQRAPARTSAHQRAPARTSAHHATRLRRPKRVALLAKVQSADGGSVCGDLVCRCSGATCCSRSPRCRRTLPSSPPSSHGRRWTLSTARRGWRTVCWRCSSSPRSPAWCSCTRACASSCSNARRAVSNWLHTPSIVVAGCTPQADRHSIPCMC